MSKTAINQISFSIPLGFTHKDYFLEEDSLSHITKHLKDECKKTFNSSDIRISSIERHKHYYVINYVLMSHQHTAITFK